MEMLRITIRRSVLLSSIFIVWILAGFLPRAASPPESIWSLWPAVRISPSDPYLLRHRDLESMLDELTAKGKGFLRREIVGQSAEGRNLNLMLWGEGKTRIFLWSQMHGDEPTATSALLDLMNWMNTQAESPQAQLIRSRVQLMMLPMLNPDGGERTRRRNAQGIDINRDALMLTTPEGRVLKAVRDRYHPEIGFNLHNQNPRTSVGETTRPVVISLLAVPYDKEGNDNPGRIRSKKICALIYQHLGPYCYTQISRYDDSFNVRAFGDQMTAWGTPTVLIESGWPGAGGEEYLVRLNFLALLSVLEAVAEGTLEQANPAVYDALLENQSGLIFDWILRGATLLNGNKIAPYSSDVAINFSDLYDEKKERRRVGSVAEVGDLSVFGAHQISPAGDWVLSPSELAAGPPQGEILPGSRDLFIYRRKPGTTGLDASALIPVASLRRGILDDKGLK